jgi:predicted amidohydrolase
LLFLYLAAILSPSSCKVYTNFVGIHVAPLVCWDIEFPEPARILALRGK